MMERFLPGKAERYKEYRDKVVNCTKCGLCKEGQHVCPGWGNLDSKIMFVGEAPGEVKNPALRGIVFVGNKSSDQYHEVVDPTFGFFNVFHTNIVKCNPPKNRTPTKEEINLCWVHLKREIDLIDPKMIVAVGRTTSDLFGLSGPLAKLQHPWETHHWNNIPVYAVYHPAYILRMGRGPFLKKYISRFEFLKKEYDKIMMGET